MTNRTRMWVLLNNEALFLDNLKKCEEAERAIRKAGLDSAPVWVGDPDGPDAYKNGQVLYAARRSQTS